MDNFFKHKMRGKSPAAIAGIVILIVIGVTALFILFGLATMWLWNWLMPDLFGLPTLTFWKALGLVLLAKIFFGFGGGGGSSKSHSHSKKSKKKKDFSKWAHYDKFWEEEGEKAYAEYCEKINNPKEDDPQSADSLDTKEEIPDDLKSEE